MSMDDTQKEALEAENRRAFMKTVGRTLVLGLTGAGIAVMIKKGQIDPCINQLSPCSQCVVLSQGCQLPKAQDHRRANPDVRTS